MSTQHHPHPNPHEGADLRPAARRAVRRGARRQAGVTLIEIMIVLAIIGLIMGILVGPRVYRMFSEAKTETAWLMAKEFESAYAKWMDDNEGECPEQLDELTKYTNKRDTKDPWGQPYQMMCADSAPPDLPFGVMSLGPDKREGTSDDVKSWERPGRK